MPVQEPGHPLFLTEDSDDDPVSVSEIQIARVENGQQVFYPRLFPANELQSLEQVSAELGGGSYILIARHEGRITTRRKYVLPGKPKPMYDEGRQEKETPAPSAPAIDPMMAMIGMGGGQGGIMPILMMMFQQQNAAADRQTQMFIAMMNGNKESTADEKAQARAELQASVERERINSERQMAMFREMMVLQSSRPSGGGEGFTQGAEFMRSIMTNQIEAIKANTKDGGEWDINAILETISQVVQGASLLKGMSGGPLPEGAPVVTEIPQS